MVEVRSHSHAAMQGAKPVDLILRAAYCPLGGTAENIVQSIDKTCLSRLRDRMRRWEAAFRQKYPEEIWTGPDPKECGLHRLGCGGAIMSDTCNTARLAKNMLCEAVADAVQENIGAEAWAAMSATEQEFEARSHPVDCWQHLRNIFLAEMSKVQVSIASEVSALWWHIFVVVATGIIYEGGACRGARNVRIMGTHEHRLRPGAACNLQRISSRLQVLQRQAEGLRDLASSDSPSSICRTHRASRWGSTRTGL